MLFRVSLEGIAAEEDKRSKPKKSKKEKEKQAATLATTAVAASMAEEFLKKHPITKIVVVVDTHYLDNGYFVYTGDSPDTYKACSLKEASILFTRRYCLPHFFGRLWWIASLKGSGSTFLTPQIPTPTCTRTSS
jgi:hypothetical protein